MNTTINTTGTVLRSLTRDRKGAPMLRNARERYAIHAGEQGWVALIREDAELAELLGFTIVAIEEDPLPPTTKERYVAAIKAIRKSGVSIRQNVSACCPGCAEPFKTTKGFDEETTPFAWNFGGQGGALRWSENGQEAIVSREGYGYHEVTETTVYFNHGNGSAAEVLKAFDDAGFEATWDGEKHSCVEVTVPASMAERKRRSW